MTIHIELWMILALIGAILGLTIALSRHDAAPQKPESYNGAVAGYGLYLLLSSCVSAAEGIAYGFVPFVLSIVALVLGIGMLVMALAVPSPVSWYILGGYAGGVTGGYLLGRLIKYFQA